MTAVGPAPLPAMIALLSAMITLRRRVTVPVNAGRCPTCGTAR
ncbi:hypothetical protein [Micromonospora nigra]|nr:hypothetical protein [Micromonospora nigra]